jgi:kinesin family protein 1
MMGYDSPGGEEVGVIPRLCEGLLLAVNSAIHNSSGTELDSNTEIVTAMKNRVLSADLSLSYYEIYNEKVHDLLSNSPDISCKVRESKEEGAFVENLTRKSFVNYDTVVSILEEGNKKRVTAATLMNATSSRSHAVFTVHIYQQIVPISVNSATSSSAGSGSPTNAIISRQSKVSLVDLAGSERASLTGAHGGRLVEANNINKSLSALGDVIKALSTTTDKGFVPYRNSVLTWLLKDSLEGNSKTSMLATISPTDTSFNESMSTLRYIERAKLIFTNAKINETSQDPAFVLDLQRQILFLKQSVSTANDKYIVRELEFKIQLENTSKPMVINGETSAEAIFLRDEVKR